MSRQESGASVRMRSAITGLILLTRLGSDQPILAASLAHIKKRCGRKTRRSHRLRRRCRTAFCDHL